MTTMLSNRGTTGKNQARRLAIISLFVCLAALSAFAQRRERLVDSWKPLHYDVDLTFNDQLTEISARAEISVEVLAKSLTKVDLDFGDLPIDSVLVSGTAAKFERTSEMLNVILARTGNKGDTLKVTGNYSGYQRDAMIFAKHP